MSLTTNEAAERLLEAIYQATPAGGTHSQKFTIWQQRIDAALAAERRATLERIEARWMNLTDRVFDAAGLRRGMHAIFDDEAARLACPHPWAP